MQGVRQSRIEQAKSLSSLLLTRAGEANGTRVANDLAMCLRCLGDADRVALLRYWVADLGPDPEALRDAAAAYVVAPDIAGAHRLTTVAEPRRQELLRRLNSADGGTALIVELRAVLLELLPGHPELLPLENDLRHILASWFNRGFLQLRPIDWHTSAAILQRLIAHEAVHAIQGWDDLRRRLAADRRCYGFFHPALPDEPLIFVEVALTDHISTAIAPLIDTAAPGHEADPTTAIFYSISNCQPGLRGISFGNFLIKQIAHDLVAELPSIRTLSTLSPVPGFARWLAKHSRPGTNLRQQCARYLAGEQTDGSPGMTSDPVARFHLSNGARLEGIHLDADLSPKGQAQSHGIMVNYRYFSNTILANHQTFVGDGRVTLAPTVKAILAPQTVRARLLALWARGTAKARQRPLDKRGQPTE